jgi:hypothetical protein
MLFLILAIILILISVVFGFLFLDLGKLSYDNILVKIQNNLKTILLFLSHKI